MVYILNVNGQPLMPTKRHRKVRILLNSNKAKVINRCPFTIQLLYETTNNVQEITLGVDSGSKTVGLSATTESEELYAAELTLRNDIVGLLSSRREARKTRRYRKTRYRKCRFLNRKKKDGWLSPSIENKINTHITAINKICNILPISKIIIETASFDIQKIKNPDITDTEYQEGEQFNFWNTREYVLFRDGHQCQCCHGKSKDNILNVHHIESRKTGGNAPNNLITLCETCHSNYHKGLIKLPSSIYRGMKFNHTAFMGIMRNFLLERVKRIYQLRGIEVKNTFGYITKHLRINNKLEKTHYVDARCISGNPLSKPLDCVYYQKKIRCHNRQIHKQKISKGNIRKRNQAAYKIFNFRLFDKVKINNQEGFIFGRRSSGYFDIRTLTTSITPSIGYKKIQFLESRKTIITERRRMCYDYIGNKLLWKQ